MARTKKPSKVVEMQTETTTSTAVAEPQPIAEPQPKPETAATPRPAPETQRPKAKNFFQKVRDIPKADWGVRAFIYVYCLEPICNLKVGGESKYLVKLQEPLLDEDPIGIDYGSGRYRLNLVYRKAAADQGDLLETYEFEIYNPKLPPKIPQNVWMNDARNERWKALLPKETPAPAPPTGLGTVTEAFRTFTDIQKEIREQITPPPSPPAPAQPPTPGVTLKDMLDLTDRLMQTKADNPVAELYRDEMRAMRAEMQAEREENRRLQREMRDAAEKRNAANEASATGGLKTIVSELKELAPSLKDLLGLGGEKLTEVVHGPRRQWWEEPLNSLASQIGPGLNALMGAAAQRFIAPQANGGMGQLPATAGALPPGQQAPNLPDPLAPIKQRVAAFLGANLSGMQSFFQRFLKNEPYDPDGPDGWDFAEWIHRGNPSILVDARQLGAANIKAMFVQSPLWVALKPDETKFDAFLDQVIRFEAPPEDAPDSNAVEQPVDLTEEEGE